MAQTPGDDKQEPSLELPSLGLPGLGRRKKSRQEPRGERSQETGYVEEPDQPVEPPVQQPASVHTEPILAYEAPRRRASRERPGVPLPTVPGRLAAAVTGLLVGAAGGGATYAALAGCEAVRGVSTCGGAPGFFILVAILALMVLLGAAILRAFRVGAPGSTSFLGVGLVTVVAMLFLLDVIYSPWMFVLIPVLGALAYLLAHWVTTRFDEEPRDLRR